MPSAHPPILRWSAAAPGATLTAERMALPPPAAEEVRIRIAACGLNHADLLMLKGRYQDMPAPPITPGMEVSGTVEACGPDVARLPVGTRVALFAGHGGLAEAANCAAALCTRLPDAIGFDIGAAFQVTYGTALLALSHRARLAAGERLIVTGAAGGAGLAAVEIGALLGAEVVAIARGADKLATCQKAGATHLIDSEATDIREQVKALGGADVVYDTVGGDLWQALFRAANPEARLLPVGFAGGEVPQIPANHLLVKNLTLIGVNWGAYRHIAPEILSTTLERVMDWIVAGRLTVHIGKRVPLSQAPQALDALRDRSVTGKIVVVPD